MRRMMASGRKPGACHKQQLETSSWSSSNAIVNRLSCREDVPAAEARGSEHQRVETGREHRREAIARRRGRRAAAQQARARAA